MPVWACGCLRFIQVCVCIFYYSTMVLCCGLQLFSYKYLWCDTLRPNLFRPQVALLQTTLLTMKFPVESGPSHYLLYYDVRCIPLALAKLDWGSRRRRTSSTWRCSCLNNKRGQIYSPCRKIMKNIHHGSIDHSCHSSRSGSCKAAVWLFFQAPLCFEPSPAFSVLLTASHSQPSSTYCRFKSGASSDMLFHD